ncbi:hypothetical protein DI005_15825 [Prauserella sp. PE36]|uniref:Uncharacterized protein n=1 Tax=Prauserella endophytica TaxID=1592324 RepID=A0ABY2SC95_9PSEU|nr:MULTISPECIES: hypothetical protein [Prauserella]RBM19171.1 hypothetical protein DI005_15825 [Prauserella sp. PE36]TKG73565.1 hypothetical protein FCN18_03145 [Prauserella endophytica]
MLRREMGPLPRWALLCALALAVVAMHHVGSAPPAHGPESMPAVAAATVADGHPAPDHGSHDLFHLCLAVLAAVGGLLLAAWFLGRVARSVPPVRRAIPLRAGARAPPRGGRDILHLACVIRV